MRTSKLEFTEVDKAEMRALVERETVRGWEAIGHLIQLEGLYQVSCRDRRGIGCLPCTRGEFLLIVMMMGKQEMLAPVMYANDIGIIDMIVETMQ